MSYGPARLQAGAACIYYLRDPDSLAIRYVGYSSDPSMRLRQHLRLRKKSPVKCWVGKLLREGRRPLLDVRCILDSATEAKRVEVAVIAALRARGERLTNVTIGGDGAVGLVHTAETRARISEAARRNLTPETLAAMALGQRSMTAEQRADVTRKVKAWWTPERREAHAEARRGQKFSPEALAKVRAFNAKRQPHTDAAKAKMSAAVREAMLRPGFRDACVDRITRELSPEVEAERCRKISEYQRGRPKSAAQRARMSASIKAVIARKRARKS